jgi:hypothetical protein
MPGDAFNVWLYKWNDRGQFHAGLGRNWRLAFEQGGRHTGHGFANPVGRALIAKVQAGDLIIAYQTDQRAAIGICRVVGVVPEGDEPAVQFEPTLLFANAVKLHELKRSVPELQAVQALRQGPVQSFYELTPGEARTVLAACGVDVNRIATVPTKTEPLRLAETPAEVAASIATFNAFAHRHALRARSLVNRTQFWVYAPRSRVFGPGKFVGFAGMSFRWYERENAGDSIGGVKFDGGRTHRGIESALRRRFAANVDLSAECLKWGENLLGVGAFGGANPRKWKFIALPATCEVPTSSGNDYPDDVSDARPYAEGSTKTVLVNIYERNPAARAACVAHYGLTCSVCAFDFATAYGEIGEGFIHVHHLKPLATIGTEYIVDPIADLRPVCPNCHAMIHRSNPPLTIEELRQRLARAGEGGPSSRMTGKRSGHPNGLPVPKALSFAKLKPAR